MRARTTTNDKVFEVVRKPPEIRNQDDLKVLSLYLTFQASFFRDFTYKQVTELAKYVTGEVYQPNENLPLENRLYTVLVGEVRCEDVYGQKVFA